MSKNYIVLNGKHYDAVTGALLKSSSNSSHAARAHTTTASKLAAKAPDRSTRIPVRTSVKPVSRVHHATPKAVHGHRPQHPKTLMRHAVKKPTHGKTPGLKPIYPVAKTKSEVTLAPKVSAVSIDGVRSRRAQQIHKSHQVSRFAVASATAVPTKIKPLTIKPAPSHAHTAAHSVVKPHAKASVIPQTLAEKKTSLLEQALANAKSHEERTPKTKRRLKHRRFISSLTGLAAVLVIGSFVVYANRASVELQVASVRAGFQASMPSYTPAGYERQTAKASDGKVAINFVSPIQKKDLTLTQESSSWDSQTLFDSIVAQETTTYQAIQSKGRTIYMYGGNKAAWVDGGILYKVASKAPLNNEQIISLATSM